MVGGRHNGSFINEKSAVTLSHLSSRIQRIAPDIRCTSLYLLGYLPFHTVAFSGLFCFKRKGQDQCKTPFRTLNPMLLFDVRGQGRSAAPQPPGNRSSYHIMFSHIIMEHRERSVSRRLISWPIFLPRLLFLDVFYYLIDFLAGALHRAFFRAAR